jgi:hypothetical protein
MEDILKEIIKLTAEISDDGKVWGKDTEIGHIDDVIDEALGILQRELIIKPEKLRKRILFEMVDWGGFTLKELVESGGNFEEASTNE